MITRLRRSPALWGVLDQSVSSLTNFILGFVVATVSNPREFGAFSIAFTVFLIFLGGSRAATSEPLLVRYSACDPDARNGGRRAAAGTALVIGIIGFIACSIYAQVAGGSVGRIVFCVGIVLPGLLLQDSWRYSFFSGGENVQAFLNDLSWIVVLVPSFFVLHITDNVSVPNLVLVWGAAGTTAAIVGSAQARLTPKPTAVLMWFKENGDLAPRFVGEFALTRGSSAGGDFLVGSLAGLSVLGAVRAGQLLLGPIQVIFMSIGLFGIPLAVRRLSESMAALNSIVRRISAALSILAVCGGATVLLIPTSLGTRLLGLNWSAAREVAPVLTVAMAGLGLSIGAVIGLRALAAARRSLKGQIGTALVTLLGSILGALSGDPIAVAWYIALAQGCGALIFWYQYRAAINDSSRNQSWAREST